MKFALDLVLAEDRLDDQVDKNNEFFWLRKEGN